LVVQRYLFVYFNASHGSEEEEDKSLRSNQVRSDQLMALVESDVGCDDMEKGGGVDCVARHVSTVVECFRAHESFGYPLAGASHGVANVG
jgi:hypothetical protein